MLTLLRLALGWHFLYEGIWKIRHADQFVGEMEGYLSAARGPLAGCFYGMIPDVDGHQRLEANLAEVKDPDAKGAAKETRLSKSWDNYRQGFVDYYRPKDNNEITKKLHQRLIEEAQKVYDRHVRGLNEFVSENGEKIKAHFESLKRYEEGLKSDPRTMFQTQRRWDEMQELRKEAKGWIAELDSRENALKAELLDLVRKERESEVITVILAAKKEAAAKAVVRPEASTTAPTTGSKSEPIGPKTAAAKNFLDEKPSDPPRDLSLGPAQTKTAPTKTGTTTVQSKEAAESGREESGEADDDKTVKSKTVAPTDKKTAEKKTAEKTASSDAKPHAEKAKDAAAATPVVLDLSPLADGKPENGPFARSSNIFSWKRTEQLAFLMTWTLFAVGLCLMLGLFTRPAALLGAIFLLFVVMSQPSYNGVYPLDPPQLGHALVVNKDFVELIALLLIATTRIGRWTGLDFFMQGCLSCCCCKSSKQVTTGGRKK